MATAAFQSMLEKISSVQEAVAQAQQIVQQQEQQAAAADEAEQARLREEAASQAALFAAIVEASYLVAASDGSVSDSERAKIGEGIAQATSGQLTADQVEPFLQTAAERRTVEGASARYAAIAGVLSSDELRRAALSLASGVAWLNQGVGEKEGLVLQALARAFGLPISELHKIMGAAKG